MMVLNHTMTYYDIAVANEFRKNWHICSVISECSHLGRLLALPTNIRL